jgi:CRISPR-associated protein Cmr4
MFERGCLFMYRALTGLHCGAPEGESGLDLPVVREGFSNIPIIPGSSLKGVWRDYCRRDKCWQAGGDKGDTEYSEVEIGFGLDPDSEERKRPYSGCLSFNDAYLLFLPIRCSYGTYVMLTCPMQLERYLEVRGLAGLDCEYDRIHDLGANDHRLVYPAVQGDTASVFLDMKGEQKVFLEDWELELAADPEGDQSILASPYFDTLPLRARRRFVIASNEVFQWLASNGLEVAAHNQLEKDTKKSLNLWYEEVVPAESVFFQLVLTSTPRVLGHQRSSEASTYLDKLAGTQVPFFQVGGHETKGRGILKYWVDRSWEASS